MILAYPTILGKPVFFVELIPRLPERHIGVHAIMRFRFVIHFDTKGNNQINHSPKQNPRGMPSGYD